LPDSRPVVHLNEVIIRARQASREDD
jgi:hypothetical protein